MKKDITELYCFIDDFCKIYSAYEQKRLLPTNKKRNRQCSMNLPQFGIRSAIKEVSKL